MLSAGFTYSNSFGRNSQRLPFIGPIRPVNSSTAAAIRTRHTNPILKAMVLSPRTAPWVPRRLKHGRTWRQATRPRRGGVMASDDSKAAAERLVRPRLLPARGTEGLDLTMVAAGADPTRPRAIGQHPG